MGSFGGDQVKEIACALEQSGHRFLWSLRYSPPKDNLWFGVPIATWPMFAEQQFNAFQLVRELGLAVEIKMDYRKELNTDGKAVIVTSEEIERGIRCLMAYDTDIRKRVKEMSVISRKALMDGGSSFSSLGRFITDVIDNIS
ncbi:hypothetical protein EZV62_015561 [Acer yangbiense]|uniref:Uncharacterized protein n=1 Tax=Acer yangbiense TaxID=1000413 RepID=A0A5C7HMY9_9ROSI|nr:hypothetical protein EZV62_015561 [Acer yangbiense]